jgi:hypothetical protein
MFFLSCIFDKRIIININPIWDNKRIGLIINTKFTDLSFSRNLKKIRTYLIILGLKILKKGAINNIIIIMILRKNITRII